MEAIYQDYAPRGVRFFYIYKALAHPGYDGYVTPFSLAERLQHVAEAKVRLGSQISWICDTLENDLKHSMGNSPNSEFVIDPDGVLVRRRAWSNPAQLRRDLAELVGEVDKPTRPEDVGLVRRTRSRTAPVGVVPRIELPSRMSPLVVEPLEQDQPMPFYAKLRAEASSDLLARGTGDLYLGFFLDPLYKVHWNNAVDSLKFEIQTSSGASITPARGVAAIVEVATDADPREFLVRAQWQEFENPLRVTVNYFACDDAETFCIPVTQHYRVYLRRDRDGGRRRMSRRPGATTSRESREPSIDALLLKTLDRDSDGELSAQELAGAATALRQLDRDRNGTLDDAELQRPPPVRLTDRYRQYAARLMRKYDRDQDGQLVPEEWEAMAQNPQLADTDGDDIVSPEELLRWLEAR